MNREDGFWLSQQGSPSSTLSKDVGSISCSVAGTHLATRSYYTFEDIARPRRVPHFLCPISLFLPYSSVYFLPCHHFHSHFRAPVYPPAGRPGALIRANSCNFSLSCYPFPPGQAVVAAYPFHDGLRMSDLEIRCPQPCPKTASAAVQVPSHCYQRTLLHW
jgi:hypothetical protein